MKVDIYGGEAFPIYEVSAPSEYSDTIIEIDEHTLTKWKEAFENFSKIQQEIVEQMKKQGLQEKVWSNGIWIGFDI